LGTLASVGGFQLKPKTEILQRDFTTVLALADGTGGMGGW